MRPEPLSSRADNELRTDVAKREVRAGTRCDVELGGGSSRRSRDGSGAGLGRDRVVAGGNAGIADREAASLVRGEEVALRRVRVCSVPALGDDVVVKSIPRR